MPVSIKPQKPAEPVPMAQTPEFKALQDKVAEAKTILDEVMTAIAALESKAPPQGGQAVQPSAAPGGPGVQAMTQESIKYNELARIVALTGK
jgi:hypothetical protein